jgi:hypothetical protein
MEIVKPEIQEAVEIVSPTTGKKYLGLKNTHKLKKAYGTTHKAGTTITYTELYEGSGKENFDFTPQQLSVSAQRVFLVDWNDRYAIVSDFSYTLHPSILFIYCMTFGIEGWGKSGSTINDFEFAKVTLGYKNLPYNPTNYKEVSYKASGEVASMDKNGVEFEDGDNSAQRQVNESPQIILPMIDCDIMLHQQSNFDAQGAADDLIGKINADAFSPDTRVTWPADQVLYKGYECSEKYFIGDNVVFEITHHFTFSFYDWRLRFNPATGQFSKVIAKVGGDYLYQEGDFGSLSIPS